MRASQMNSPTSDQRTEIDAHILAGEILKAIGCIRTAYEVGLRDAADLNRARYNQLRTERPEDFQCDDKTYWSGYSECAFDAMARNL